jgi:5'-nucleotidase
LDTFDEASATTTQHHGGHGGRKPITVKVIGINDFHGNLQSPGTFGVNLSVPPEQRPPVGGPNTLPATSPD